VRSAGEGVAIAGLSLAVVETMRMYRETAPSLEEIRRAAPGDYVMRQLVLDADMMGIVVIIAIGGGALYLTGNFYPLMLGALSLAMISGYYRAVLRSSNEGMT
jgi:hypothetical protein